MWPPKRERHRGCAGTIAGHTAQYILKAPSGRQDALLSRRSLTSISHSKHSMSLSELGFDEHAARDDGVALLVGPNGAGKSFYMLQLALNYRTKRQVTVISNTPYGRLNHLNKVNKISGGRNGASPGTIIKNAIAKTLDRESSEFYQLTSILDYCHYHPSLGFRMKGCDSGTIARFESLMTDVHRLFKTEEEFEDYASARRFIERWDHDDILWVDSSQTAHQYSLSREFAAVLRCEKFLKKAGITKGVEVYLAKKNGAQFELSGASSGELSLICSMFFLATTVEENSLVLIDEPENSLHPGWQREYVGKIFAALGYRNASVIIATHSPMLVTGAVTERPDLISVYEIRSDGGHGQQVTKKIVDSGGIEAILWKIFEIVTPENHFVSEEIVETINQYERNQLSKSDVLTLISRMRRSSFDDTQTEFFSALFVLVDKVEARKIAHASKGSNKDD
ncbi:hypothetical protein CWC48_25780 [Pseudomonas sp. S10E 269]|nr:hypothetical protein CWC49_06225 [Pseudomonas sp. S09F 262]PJK42401.1 hypothetical protein CWC48_25780 [Pseudomonas sp. S10E 269]